MAKKKVAPATTLFGRYPAMFPVERGDRILTCREAACIAVCLDLLGDWCKYDANELDGRPVTIEDRDDLAGLGLFPMSTWRMPTTWRLRLAQAFHDLSDDIDSGRDPIPRCPAEEAALWLALNEVESFAKDEMFPEIAQMPIDPNRDGDWFRLGDELFQDSDIEFVMRPGALDGIEDPSNDINQLLRIGDYRPPAWFNWFSNVEPRTNSAHS